MTFGSSSVLHSIGVDFDPTVMSNHNDLLIYLLGTCVIGIVVDGNGCKFTVDIVVSPLPGKVEPDDNSAIGVGN